MPTTSPKNTATLQVDEIFVATGRRPNIKHLGLVQAGVDSHSGGVVVDDFLRTSNSDIYASGDVTGLHQFTHAADAMSRIVLANALFFGRKRVSRLIMPRCTFTEPELAHVGIRSLEAEGQGLSSVRVELSHNDRAIVEGATPASVDASAFAKAYYQGRRGQLVSATIVAPAGGELLAELTLAMTQGLGLADIAGTIHPYPTRSELVKRMADQFMRTKVSARLLCWLARYFRWRRS